MLDTVPARNARHVIALALVRGEAESILALSNRIRELRFKRDEMTQKQLAERVGVSRQTMNAIENGRHAPTIDVAIRIADVFGITVDQLFDLDYEGRPVRRERATTIDVDRSEAVVEESVEIAADVEPAEKEAGKRPIFADLARIIDS